MWAHYLASWAGHILDNVTNYYNNEIFYRRIFDMLGYLDLSLIHEPSLGQLFGLELRAMRRPLCLTVRQKGIMSTYKSPRVEH